jgi:UDP-N-acetylglucosamine diphosphorylase / glucose-1-phosphate thymidylyltransferase / UDP-N-acetylgalactosamine diphosphorylase / glucosamine-1-phosphate N-acetyltransferase / galactosamine-1-phosphate N-acetyltransferase
VRQEPASKKVPYGPLGSLDAVILCAGQGRRLRPLTASLPKVLVPVRGEALLDHHLKALAEAGTRRVILVVGHLQDQVRAHVATNRAFGMRAVYVIQEPLAGTGDGLRRALPEVTSDPFVLVYGDVFLDGLRELYSQLLAERIPSVVAAEVPDVSPYGRLVLAHDPAGLRLRNILEKDPRGGPGFVNAGIFLLPGAIRRNVEQLRTSVRGEFELTDALTSYVAEGGDLRVLPRGGWVDVGSPLALEALNKGATAGG